MDCGAYQAVGWCKIRSGGGPLIYDVAARKVGKGIYIKTGQRMNKWSVVFLVFFLILMVTFFVILFMGLDGGPTIAPRSPL